MLCDGPDLGPDVGGDVKKTLVVLMASTALLGAACSNANGSSGGGGGSSSAGCTAATATDLTGSDPFTITMKGSEFHPSCFEARSAAAISIENQDTVVHTFTVDGTQVDVTIQPGQTFNGKSAGLAPGTYPFHCTIHPTMTGTVIVS